MRAYAQLAQSARPAPNEGPDHLDCPIRRTVASSVDDRRGSEVPLGLYRNDRKESLRATGVHTRAFAFPLLHAPAECEVLIDRRMQSTEGIGADEPRRAAK